MLSLVDSGHSSSSVALPSRRRGTRSEGHDFQSLYPGAAIGGQSAHPQGIGPCDYGGVSSLGISSAHRDLRQGPESLACAFASIVCSVRARARDVAGVLYVRTGFLARD